MVIGSWFIGSVQGRPDLHFVSIFTNDAFWRVSADTETCGSPLYLSPTGDLSPAGGLCLPAG